MKQAAVFALLVAGCAGGGELPEPRRPAKPPVTAATRANERAWLESVRFASVPVGTYGPYVADTVNGGVAVWAQTVEKGRAWFGVAFGADGVSKGPAAPIAPAPAEVGLAVVEPALGGFALLWTRREGDKTVLDSLELDDKARAKANAITLSEVSGDVVWVDWVTTSAGALALWGVKTPAGVDLFAALSGRERVEPKPFATGALAWQAAPLGSGAAVGLVMPGDKAATGGQVEVRMLDPEGGPGERISVSASATASTDLDMVAIDRGLVLAWSDQKELEARVTLAALDSTGKVVRKPSPAVAGVGEETLVRLVHPHAKGGPAYLAWESLIDRPAHGRTITLAPLKSDGTLGVARAQLDHVSRDGSLPELAATSKGLAALTLAHACRRGDSCAGAALLPTFVAFDEKLVVLGSEPLHLKALSGEAPDLAWGLTCASQPCRVLAARAKSPAPVFSVRAETRASDWEPAARQASNAGPPRVASLEVLAKTDPLAAVAATHLGTTSLAAWLTYFDPAAPWQRLTRPAADGRLDPPRALLQVRALPETGAALPAETISIRARSPGGVALAAAAAGSSEALLAWTAIDFKLPQVFLTVLDAKGKKLRQRMLTRGPGDKTDLSVTGVGDGWVVAWIDERNGDPEVYAARVNRLLQNVGPEKRITNTAGTASDVALLRRSGDALVAWSDARDKDRPGVGDIFVASLKAADASLVGKEQIVAKTPHHSRSPVLAALGKGALLGFIEERVSEGESGAEAEARVVEIGEDGRPVGNSTPLALKGVTPTTMALDCQGDACRVLLGVTRGTSAELWAGEWAGGKVTAPVRLMALSSPASVSVTPSLLGRELVFGDRAGNEGRPRRALIDWK